MPHFIGCDAHKKFSVFVMVDEHGRVSQPMHVEHEREAYRSFLQRLPGHSEIALEACGFWYWMVDEMEAAGHVPRLANPTESKKCIGKPHKHDPLDAKGVSILLRNGTLPECWIPPKPLRDQRELLRTRMALRDLRASLKHRIHGALARYGLQTTVFTDLFGKTGRAYLTRCLTELPPETGRMVTTQVAAMDELTARIATIEQRIHALIEPSADVRLLMTIPGVGSILGPVIGLELLYGAGLRLGEAVRSDVTDLDLRGGMLLVRNGKGHKDRIVPICGAAAMALDVYLTASRPEILARIESALFLSRDGARLGAPGLRARIQYHGRRIDVRLTPHALRHTCATHLLRGGADLRHVQALLGHRRLTTTALYTRVAITDLRSVIQTCHPRERARPRRPRR